MSKNKKRAVAYARITSVAQADGTSLDMQSAEMVRLANEMGYGIDPADVLREIASGASLDRPQLYKIRRMAAAGEIDALFVYSIDRLSRDPVDLLVLVSASWRRTAWRCISCAARRIPRRRMNCCGAVVGLSEQQGLAISGSA